MRRRLFEIIQTLERELLADGSLPRVQKLRDALTEIAESGEDWEVKSVVEALK